MELQFVIEEQSLQTLCFHYIVNHSHQSKTLIINSILLKLISTPNTKLYQLFELCCLILDENKSQNCIESITDKQYYKNLSLLLKQIITKYPLIITTANQQQLIKIIKFSSAEVFNAVCGNDYIALLYLIFSKLKQQYTTLFQTLQLMILSNKMCVGSYRQITRNHLYSMLLKIIKKKTTQQMTTEYIMKILRAIQDQKDPRNISQVFQIYLQILNKTNQTILIQLRKKLFDCLQMYYPIDFEGNSQKYHITLQDIIALHNQCLSNPLFAKQIQQLLVIKMSTPPISKPHPKTQDASIFFNNLLLRTAEEDYLQEEYQEDALYTLTDLIIQLLIRIIPNNGPLSSSSCNVILNWMNKFITQNIFNSQQNSKVAGLVISTIKNIMKKCNSLIKHLLLSYTIQQFLTHCKSSGDILYKLGMLVPIFQCKTITFDIQTIGLLVLSLSQIYHKVQQPHPKIIILKLFMLISNLEPCSKMINQINIKHYCLEKLNETTSDPKIINAYIDFLVELYSNDISVQSNILNINRIENKVYGIMKLANKLPNLRPKITQLLTNNTQNHQKIFTQFLNVITIFKPTQIFQIIHYIPKNIPESQQKQICKIIDEKYINIQINQQNFHQLLNQYLINIEILLFTKNIWRSLLISSNIRNAIKNLIQSYISQQDNHQYCGIITAFYNKTIDAFNLPSNNRIINNNIENSQEYKKQQFKMLPIQENLIYSSEQCQCWPTLVQYSWKKSKEVRKQLIEYLPTSILGSQAHRILPIILPQKDIQTMSKIIGSADEDLLINQIIPFIITYLQQITQSTQVQKIVACNKILYDLQNRSKQQQNIHNILLKYKTRILIALQKNFTHRKRRARQSSRTIFAIYNLFK